MKLLGKIWLWGLFIGASGSVLQAEPAGGWLSPTGVNGATSTTTAPTGTTTGRDPALLLSLADVQTRVHLLHDQTRADARHVLHLQQIARKEKDVIKLNCVNDKLVQIKPQMNLADSAEAELEDSTDATRMAVFDNISQAAENIRRLREEADQCVGEPTTQGGDSSNSFTGPTPPDDPTKGLPGGDIEAPGYASPYN
jgi:hypothetical protein